MKSLRSIMPLVAVALCSGFLVFTVCCAVFAEKNDRQDIPHQFGALSYQNIDFDGSSPFTRQAGDGELECEDGKIRHDIKGIFQTMQLDYSRLHSAWSSIRLIGLVRSEPSIQRLPILLQRLLI